MQELRPQTTLFCAAIAFAIALSMILRGRRSVHWLFAAFSADIAFWYASQSLATLFPSGVWVRATGVLTVLLPQLALHLFFAIVPSEGSSWNLRITRIFAVLGLPVLAIVLSPYQETSFALGTIYCYVFGLLATALIWLARRGRASPSRAVRDRVQFLVVVGIAATVFTLADFLSFVGVMLPPIGAVLSIVFIFVLAESLTRPRLADIYDMAGRLLVSTALAFALAGIFHVFIALIGTFNRNYLNAVLAAIVFMVLFEPLRSEVEKRIHQFFFRERYALETSVTELRRRLAHVLEFDEMATTLMEGLERSRRVTTAALYIRDPDEGGFDCRGHFGLEPPERIEAVITRTLSEKLESKTSLVLEELKTTDAQVAAASAMLGPLDSSVVLAVKTDSDEIVGLLFVADDRVRDAFTPEEVTLLESVAAQLGVVVANSRLYVRMKERDRLAALGAMAAGLAHEVKNPLGAIKGSAQLLEELASPDGSADAREFIGIILEEVNRLDRVVGSFLDYARPHAGNPVPIDVNAAVKRTIQIVSSQGLGEVSMSLELGNELPFARIDPEKLRQVMINLIRNAGQAMDGRGRVTITTSSRRLPRASWSSVADLSRVAGRSDDAEILEIAIRDTGPGISQKVLKNLFVPFFTTKDQGTGLGLAISQSIIQAAGGSIQVHTNPGTGTTFTIVLPAAGDTFATTRSGNPAPPISAVRDPSSDEPGEVPSVS